MNLKNAFCEYAKENIDEYEKGELLHEESEKIAEHLKICFSCRRFFKEFKKLKDLYPDFEKSFPYPQNLEEKLKKSVKELEKITSV